MQAYVVVWWTLRGLTPTERISLSCCDERADGLADAHQSVSGLRGSFTGALPTRPQLQAHSVASAACGEPTDSRESHSRIRNHHGYDTSLDLTRLAVSES